MAASRALSLRRGGPLPRLWIDSSLPNRRHSLFTPISAVPSALASVATNSSDTPSTTDAFYVLCLYDFEAEDGDQLSFRKNEMLEIVKREGSGWWAAVRSDDNHVGWIPSAFVEPISEALAERLLNTRNNSQGSEDDAGRAYGSPVQFTDPFVVSPDPLGDGDSRGYDWMPVMDGEKVPIMQLVSDAESKDTAPNVFSPLVPPHEGVDDSFMDLDADMSPTERIVTKLKAHTIMTTIQLPPQYPPAPVVESPIPTESPFSLRRSRSSSSLHSLEPSPPNHQRSHSESVNPVASRHLRRRPLLIDDRSSLTRLTTLIESNNLEELDSLISSPVVTESFDAFSRKTSTRIDKVKQITGDDEAQAFHDAQLAQSSLPWYLRPTYGEDEIKVQPDGTVTAGTLRALVERLTVDHLKANQEMKYRQVFLMTYKTFATADEVFDALVKQYNINHPTALSLTELEHWKEKRLKPTRRRVLSIFHVWSEGHGLLQDDPQIARRLVDFLDSIKAPSLAATAHDVLKSLERYISVIPTAPLSATTTSRRKKSRGLKIELLRLDATVMAEHLSIFGQRLFVKIRPQECLSWVKTQTGSSVRNLAAFTVIHEKLGAWVKMSVLNTEGLGKRADTVDFWIKVAEKCKSLNNYASMSALVVALSSAVISRLHLTWAHVVRRSQLEQLAKYNEPTGNFSAYRLLQRSVDGPCLPFVEMYLTDIININDLHPDNAVVPIPVTGTGSNFPLVNFVKRKKWYEVVDVMLRYQPKVYTFVEDPSITTFIETNLAVAGERDQGSFWMKSQEVQQAEMSHADIRKGLELAGF
ncbi:Cell division control protein 25 [Grifola frondosa]|uniref:Cell division control protein 25 n=1 Tax=Grifola frondosa TaxID=5627 RepID=A0A1C7MSP3_GRIFR|nr:Cell division control protein 25 [Grifola frondosa]